jgi:hypothetical protein
MTFAGERSYAGNLGYADDPSQVYQYDNFVANHRQIAEGDLAILRESDKLLGIARIERIEVSESTKERLRCPECRTTELIRRKVKIPQYRCVNGHTFDIAAQETLPCTQFTAYFGDTFVSAQEALHIDMLRAACPKYNRQLAMQRLDFTRIETTLVAQIPEIKKLLVRQANSDYLHSEDAEQTKDDRNISSTTYFPVATDSRKLVMRQIRARRGQQAFRQVLRSRYGDRCMITNCELIDIVEAAHISPYRNESDNHPENGILLRADLHTLFDLDLLGIQPESLEVQFHPVAKTAGYEMWEGQTLLYSNARPSQAGLESRWGLFLMRLKTFV